MTVVSALLSSFKDVSTIKQMPNRFDDALRIWGDLSLEDFTIPGLVLQKITRKFIHTSISTGD